MCVCKSVCAVCIRHSVWAIYDTSLHSGSLLPESKPKDVFTTARNRLKRAVKWVVMNSGLCGGLDYVGGYICGCGRRGEGMFIFCDWGLIL